MNEPEPAKIKKYQDYMWRFEGFCLTTRPSMFPSPAKKDMEEIQEVHKWLSGFHNEPR